MDSIAITKPNMGMLPQDRQGLSPFGVLSQAFSQELLARAGFQEGHWPLAALDLLEEGEEAPASALPVQPVVQVDLKLMLQIMRQMDIRTEKAVERVVERIARLREQGRPPSKPARPEARRDGRNGAVGQEHQTAGPKAAGEHYVQGGPGRTILGPDGGKHARQTPAASAAGAFVYLQKNYHTLHQHLQFTTNIRGPGIWQQGGAVPPQRPHNLWNIGVTEPFRWAHELQRMPVRQSVSAPVGSSALAGAAALTAGNRTGLLRYHAHRYDAGYPTTGELAYLKDGTGGAGMNGTAKTAADSRRIRQETGLLERVLAAQVLQPGTWVAMYSGGASRPETQQWTPPAQMLQRDIWAAALGLDLWKQSARGERFGREKVAGWPPQSIRQPWGAERPMPGEALLAPPGGISTIKTAAPAGRTHWNKYRWSGFGLSAGSGWPGAEGQAASALAWDTPDSVLSVGGELAHRVGAEEEGLSRQAASKAEPAERGVFGIRTVSEAALRSVLVRHGPAVPGLGEPTARNTGSMRVNAAAPAADSGRLPSMSLEGAGQSHITMEARPKTGPQGRPVLLPFSQPPGEALTYGAVPSTLEWDLRAGAPAGGVRASTDRMRRAPDALARPLKATEAVQYEQAPQANPAVIQSKPLISALWDIRTIPAEQSPTEPGEVSAQSVPQTGEPLSTYFGPGARLIHSTGLYWDRVPGPTEAGVQTPTASAAQAREQGPQADYPQGKTGRAKSAAQTGSRGTQSSALWRQVHTGARAGFAERAEGTAALRHTPLAVHQREDSFAVALRDIRPFTAGLEGVLAGSTKAPQWKRSALPHQEPLPPEEMRYSPQHGDTAGAGVDAPQKSWSALPRRKPLPPEKMRYSPQSGDTAGAGMDVPQKSQSTAPRRELLPPEEMLYSTQSGDTARAGVEAQQKSQSTAPHRELLPPEEMLYSTQSGDTAGTGMEAPQRERSSAPHQERFLPGKMIYGAQNQDMPGAGTDAARHTVPDPLELTYSGTDRPSAGDAPGPAARGQKPASDSMESDYVRTLPDWARRFLQEGAPQTREEAVRRMDTGRGRTMGVAQGIAVLPSFSNEAGTAFQWTAPDARGTVPVEYREPRRQQDLPQPHGVHISDTELQRTADRVYRIIEDRIRRERWRLGL